MRPYTSIKLTEGPNLSDIKNEARCTRAGRAWSKSGELSAWRGRTNRKRVIRRWLKRRDRQRVDRLVASYLGM